MNCITYSNLIWFYKNMLYVLVQKKPGSSCYFSLLAFMELLPISMCVVLQSELY